MKIAGTGIGKIALASNCEYFAKVVLPTLKIVLVPGSVSNKVIIFAFTRVTPLQYIRKPFVNQYY